MRLAQPNPADQSDLILVDCIYSSAVEPSRFERLVDTWDAKLRTAGYAAESLAKLNGNEIVDHFSKAQEASTRISDLSSRSLAEAAVARIDTAALVCAADGRIIACNAAAARAFPDAQPGNLIASLPFSQDGIEQFTASIAHVTGADDGRHEILRLRPEPAKQPVYAFVRPLRDGQALHALIVTTEHVWQPEVESALQRAFAFTAAEVNVLRMIMSGVSVAEIAASLGRSEATIRSQIHNLLGKTGTRSQAELMSLTLAFQDSTDEDAMAVHTVRRPAGVSANPYETLALPDGRSLDYLRLGDPVGRSFIWLHGNLSQCRLPWPAERWLQRNGIAMIVPIRAGYGYSSPLPKGGAVIATAISDICLLRSHLDLAPSPVAAHCNDFLLACSLALAEPALFTHVFGIGAAFAIETPEEYARLNKWARFFRANARHAPRVLAFLGRASYTMVRTIGYENYVEGVMKGTPDIAAFADPAIRAAILAGMEILWGEGVRAHDAFAADTIAVHRDPWPDLGKLIVPVTLVHGEQDHNSSCLTAKEHAARHGWKTMLFPETAVFSHHIHWEPMLREIATSMGVKTS